jgi:hypothetical protein
MLEEILNTRIMAKQFMKKHAKVCHYLKGFSLSQMLEEILNTRIMVRRSMKKHAMVCYYFKGWPLTVVG